MTFKPELLFFFYFLVLQELTVKQMHEASINLSSASKYELTFLKKKIELIKI